MSCNVSKIVLRAELKELKGKSANDAFMTYLTLLGEPDKIEEYDGEIEHFSYEGMYQPVYDYKRNRWGIDLVLHHESGYRVYTEMKTNGLSFAEFDRLTTVMSNKFSVEKNEIKIISYTWYNGGDEPILF